jgi:hypothetical protein
MCEEVTMQLRGTRPDGYTFCDNEIKDMSSLNLIYILN